MAETPTRRRVRLAAPFVIFAVCGGIQVFDHKLNRLDSSLQLALYTLMAVALVCGVGLAIYNMVERRRHRAAPKVFD